MNKKLLAIAIASTTAAIIAPITHAQDEESQHAKGLEQVIVSARRVEENVQDVPLAISAMSSDQLEQAGVANFGDIAKAMPAIQTQNGTGRSSAQWFGIRGQMAADVLLTQDQAIGVYIGGVPFAWPYGIGITGAFDIGAMEVAKGPQGTLFGKNTTGGAVVISPNEPNQSFEGNINGGIGNYHRYEIGGMINVPLTDTLAARIAAEGIKRDGVVRNLSNNTELNDLNEWGARISLKWTPSDSLSSLLVFDQADSRTGGVGQKLIGAYGNMVLPAGPGVGLASGAHYAAAYEAQRGDGFWETRTPYANEYQDMVTWGLANTTTWEASPQLTIKNILAYRNLDLKTLSNLSGTNPNDYPPFAVVTTAPLTIPGVGTLPVGTPVASAGNLVFGTAQFAFADAYSEELQLIGTTDSADWIAGLFYSHITGRDGSASAQLSPSTNPNSLQQGPRGELVNESIAVFGQSVFHLTDALNLTVGVRGTRDNRDIRYNTYSLDPATGAATACGLSDRNGPLPIGNCVLERHASNKEPTWNISLDYKITDDQLIYVAHRHGYRSGGFPGRGSDPLSTEPFGPEKVNDYEIGHKIDADIAGMPLRVNSAVFYQSYHDIQRNSTLISANGQLANTVINAANATIWGGEIEATFVPFDDLELKAFYSHIDASYDSFVDPNTGEDKSSLRFGSTPKNSGNFSARYRLPLPTEVGDVYLQGSVYAQSGTALYGETNDTNPTCNQGGYSIYNARADWQNVLGNTGLQLSAWGKNLGNREYYTSALCLGPQIGFNSGYQGDPRTFGITAAYSF